MGYQLQILGLITMHLLITFYWYRKSFYTNKDTTYKYLLVTTYIYILLDIATYITKDNINYYTFYNKLYIILSLTTYLGTLLYIVNSYIKEYFCNNSLKRKQNLIISNSIYAILVIIHIILVLFSPINNYLILFIYMILEIITLMLISKRLKPRTNLHLLIILLISILSLTLQYYFKELDFLTIGSIIIALYLYLTLENMGIEELDTLRLEKKYAQKQNIDKELFLKNISHEIRTPLNTIDGFSQIIIDNDNIEEIKKDVSDIRVASRDLIDVINGMIDLSIIESGNLEIVEENYNVYDMLDSITAIAKSKLRDKDVTFKTKIDKDIPEVLYGDSERISQVVLNLIKNSIKYTDKGSITLNVSRIKSDTLCRLKIEVIDTGKSLTDEEIKAIYSNITEENSALNINITKYLIDKMNGSLDVDNTYKEGSSFTITLDQKIIREHQENTRKKEKVLKPFKANNKKVLIVDDNKLNIKVATRLLKPYDITVVEASSGTECLDILDKEHDFDLILMDDLMPNLSGTETMKLIKKISRVDGYYIPIVVLTANATTGQKEKYLSLGFEEYLAKPIDRYELDLILRKYLKGNLSK